MLSDFADLLVKAAITAVVLLLLIAFGAGLACAAYPYDSVAEILVPEGAFPNGDMRYAGGSATLIAVSESQALMLSCKHVCLWPGKPVHLNFSTTKQEIEGRVIAVGRNQDIAMIICPRPKGLRPVPIARAHMEESGKITNVGYPGITGQLEWQTGLLLETSRFEITYNCRPIPGMSGGATFDQYGNIIGVITHYMKLRPMGGSASGPEMIKFIRSVQDHYISKEPIAWTTPPAEDTVQLASGPPSQEMFTPTTVDEIELQNMIYSHATAVSPLITRIAPHLLVEEITDLDNNMPIMEHNAAKPKAKATKPRKNYTPKRQRKPRRLFRRNRR